jgi:hypothetical protein
MWTTTGGLLPAKAGTKGGYYRLNRVGEKPVGATGLQAGADYNAFVVTAAVRSLQKRLADIVPELGLKPSGQIGPRTDEAFTVVQMRHGLTVDGICGPKTVQAMVLPIAVSAAAQWGIPAWALIGIIGAESGWDPGAVGAETPWDTGLVQANRDAHPSITVAVACDVYGSLNWAAQELRAWRDRLGPLCVKGVLPDDVMVAAHNSPRAASEWARSGIPGKDPDPLAYLMKVRQAWKDAT